MTGQQHFFSRSEPEKENHRYCRWAILLVGLAAASSSFALAPGITNGTGGITVTTEITGFPELPEIPELPDDGRPPIPGVELEPLSASSIRIAWFDSSERATGYNVYRSLPGDSESLIETHGPVTRDTGNWGDYTDTGLTPDTEYVYRVEAHNDKGSRSLSIRTYTDRKAPTSLLVAQLHVLTQNVEGIPHIDPVTDIDLVDQGIGATDCERRGSSFGSGLAIAEPAFTLVGLQELYPEAPVGDRFACDPKYVLDAANSTGRYPVDRANPGRFIVFQPRAGLATGGTGLLSLGQMSRSYGEAWAGNYDGLLGQGSKQGFTFSRVAVPETDLEIDVYVVHLYSRVTDHCDRLCQRGELEQLAHRIATESGTSGNPVIVMGDFNLPGPPATPDTGDGFGASYIDLKEALLDPRDLWLENHPDKDGSTVRPTIDNMRGQRLDYIFVPDDPYLTNNPYTVFIRNRADVAVATSFGHVSDHIGVTATIEIRRNLTVPSNQQVSSESIQAEAVLETLDSAIETVYTAFKQADDSDDLEDILEQYFREDRAVASSALIAARRRDEPGMPVDGTTPNDLDTTTGDPDTVAESVDTPRPKLNTRHAETLTFQNQPFTPNGTGGQRY